MPGASSSTNNHKTKTKKSKSQIKKTSQQIIKKSKSSTSPISCIKTPTNTISVTKNSSSSPCTTTITDSNLLAKTQSYRSLFNNLSTVPEEEASRASSSIVSSSCSNMNHRLNEVKAVGVGVSGYNEMFFSPKSVIHQTPSSPGGSKLSTSQSMNLNYTTTTHNENTNQNSQQQQAILNRLRPVLLASTMSPSSIVSNHQHHQPPVTTSTNRSKSHEQSSSINLNLVNSSVSTNQIANGNGLASIKSKKFKPTTYYTSYANSKQEIDYSSYLYSDSVTELYLQKGEPPTIPESSPNPNLITSPKIYPPNNQNFKSSLNQNSNSNALTKTLSKSILNDLNILYNKQQLINQAAKQHQQKVLENNKPQPATTTTTKNLDQSMLDYNLLMIELKKQKLINNDLRINNENNNLAHAKSELVKQQQADEQLRHQQFIKQQQLLHQQKLQLLQLEQARLQKQIDLLREQQKLLKQTSFIDTTTTNTTSAGNAASNLGSGLNLMASTVVVNNNKSAAADAVLNSFAAASKLTSSRSISLEKYREQQQQQQLQKNLNNLNLTTTPTYANKTFGRSSSAVTRNGYTNPR